MTQEAILYILEKEHPHIVKAIHTRLQTLLPDFVFTDYGHLRDIIRFYCEFHSIRIESIQGKGTKQQVMDKWREILALLLLCYQPEKIYGISQKKARLGLTENMASLLKCNRPSLSRALPEVLFYFEKNAGFRNRVLAVHGALLKTYTTQDVSS